MENTQAAQASTRQRLQKIGLTFPRELTLTITSRCNLHCRHCLPECGPDPNNSFISIDRLRHAISQWHDAGVTQICITGGEPLLHPQWREILTFCCDKPGIQTVRLQSNGTMINQEVATLLAQSRYQKVSLQISLDGCLPEEHDKIRGEGNFSRTMAALRLLHKAGLTSRTSISFTETAENFKDLPQTLRLIDELNISSLTSNTLITEGRAADDTTLSMPTPQQYEELIELYEHDLTFRNLYERRGNISAIEWYRHRDMHTQPGNCSCMETPYINAQGTLYPCTLLPVPELAIENVWQKKLPQILDEIEKKWAHLHELDRKRPALISDCQNCSGRKHCQSGCLGRSFSTNLGSLQTEDRCLHRKAVYHWGKTTKTKKTLVNSQRS